ncbi:DoxX family membrane protein [Maribellus sp. YY47]|uniref:DoxX family membrane protein n=1 Tax=Maribellus sp. YY47 TaxID=2929486 RepID=UPI002000CEAB|nr:DoxX family membrane protein [Maribellus sp. YY47]MCK3683876.1 DoxX family membrane protein [Maribellus sp. YY47]
MKNTYTRWQLLFLMALRFLIGWHLLYEGIAKLLNPQWSSIGFLKESQWILSGFAKWVISDPSILSAVDFLNTWGLIAIGLGLILGMFFRVAALSGFVLLVVYYFNCPPLVGIEYSLPADGNNLIVNKTLIEAFALAVLAFFPTSRILGMDALMAGWKKKKEEK